MLHHLKPTDAEVEALALAETDLLQQKRYAPLRYGFLGNALVLVFAGAAGLAHAAVSTLWRQLNRRSRHGSG